MLKIFAKATKKQFLQLKIRRLFLYGTPCTAGAFVLYDDRPKTFFTAVQRATFAANIGMRVAVDYKVMQLKQYSTEIEQQRAKEDCHRRSSKRVLDALLKLGGIYVKLGQHISTMSYILPEEWTSTLAVLQDKCDPTMESDIKQMFLNDFHVNLEDVFDEFDWSPLGVASLAQVHKARLGGRWVAVKFQHPNLDEFYRIDLQTVSFIIHNIKRIFPDFGFEWIMQEMEESLPQELDFVREAANAVQLRKNFEGCSTALVVPEIIWAKSRILCMEFIEGARVDDLEFFQKHNINPSAVSTEITNIFSKMMFNDGFVHCDPHPGNILIRPSHKTKDHPYNFDVVLIDHGLYRALTDELRLNYANLWTSLIRGDEENIQKYSLQVGCKPDYHRLFASLLTGREWSTIQSSSLSSIRSSTEINRVSGRTNLFLNRIYSILEALPRIVVLLLKTSDLLRSLDETLRKSKDKYMTYALMGRHCAKTVWIDKKTKMLQSLRESSRSLDIYRLLKSLLFAWCNYRLTEFGLLLYKFQSSAREKWLLVCQQSVWT